MKRCMRVILMTLGILLASSVAFAQDDIIHALLFEERIEDDQTLLTTSTLEDMPTRIFRSGRTDFANKKYDSAIKHFKNYLKKDAKLGTPGRSIAAKNYIGKAYWLKGKRKEALNYFTQAENDYFSSAVQQWMETADPLDQDQTWNAAAEARFMRGEALFQEMIAIKLTDPCDPKELKRYLEQEAAKIKEGRGKIGSNDPKDPKKNSDDDRNACFQYQLVKKSEKLQEAGAVFDDVITKSNAPKWGIVAMVRLGMMFDDTADQIRNGPTPPDLPAEVEKKYTELLIDFSSYFLELAIRYYEKAVKVSEETGLLNELSNEAQKRLSELRLK